MTKNGFTLLEVLIAAFVIALLALGITGAAVLLTRVSVDSEQQAVALELANQQIEYLRSQPFGDVGNETAPVQTIDRNGRIFTVNTFVQDFDDIKQVKVSVTWQSLSNQARTLSLSTLIAFVSSDIRLPSPTPSPSPSPGAGGSTAYFKFKDAHDKTFIFQLIQAEKIAQARSILADPTRRESVHVSGTIVKQPASYNPPWSYHLEPASIGFPEVSIEVCDASIQFIEDHLASWGQQWCPWSARLIEEVQAPL